MKLTIEELAEDLAAAGRDRRLVSNLRTERQAYRFALKDAYEKDKFKEGLNVRAAKDAYLERIEKLLG